VLVALGVARWLVARAKGKMSAPEYLEVGEEGPGTSRVLVIGGGGFIGRLVVSSLVEDAFNERRSVVCFDSRLPPPSERLPNVRYIQGSILEAGHLRKAMQGVQGVMHLASLKKFLGVDDLSIRSVNVQGTQNVVDACLERGVRNLVYTSSITAAIKANNLSDNMNIPHNAPVSGSYTDIYAETKAAAEQIVMKAGKGGKLKVCTLRPTAVYGFGDKVVVDKLVLGGPNNNYLGSGLAEFDWIDSSSVARCHALALRSLESRACTASNQVYNCGSGEVIQYRKFSGYGTGWWGAGQPKSVPLGLAHFLATVNHTCEYLFGVFPLPPLLMTTSIIFTQVSWSVDMETTRRDLGFTTVHGSIAKSISSMVAEFQASKAASKKA